MGVAGGYPGSAIGYGLAFGYFFYRNHKAFQLHNWLYGNYLAHAGDGGIAIGQKSGAHHVEFCFGVKDQGPGVGYVANTGRNAIGFELLADGGKAGYLGLCPLYIFGGGGVGHRKVAG